MKKIIVLVLLMIVLMPFNKVYAIPGCCSWHGGEAGCSGGRTLCSDGTVSLCPCDGTSSSYSSGGENYSSNYVSVSNNDDYSILIICIFIGGFVFFAIYGLISENREKKEYADKLKKEKMQQLNNNDESKEEFVEQLVDELNSNDLSDNLINDGYLYNISYHELIDIINIDNSPENFNLFKQIIDKVCLNSDNIKEPDYFYNLALLLLKNEEYHIKYFRYLINKNCIIDNYNTTYYGLLILKSLELKNENALNIILSSKVKTFRLNYEQLNIMNNYDKLELLENKDLKLSAKSNDIEKMIENNQLKIFKLYEKYNDDYFQPTDQLVFLSIKKDNVQFFKELIKDKNQSIDFIGFDESYCHKYLEYAYLNKSLNIIKEIIKRKWDVNIFPTISGQEHFENYVKDKNEWIKPISNKNNHLTNSQFDNLIDLIKEKNIDEFKNNYSKNFQCCYNDNGDDLIFEAIKANNLEVVEFLLDANYYLGRRENRCKTDVISP